MYENYSGADSGYFRAVTQWKRVLSQEARVIRALNMGGQSTRGYTMYGSLPVKGGTRIMEKCSPCKRVRCLLFSTYANFQTH